MSDPASSGLFLSAQGLHKTYRVGATEIPVLRGVSLDVRAGEAVAVTGASGAGKSTLLHLLGGLDRPDRGTVRLDLRDLYALSENARSEVRATRIGFVFQSYYLLPELDVLENVMLPAMSRFGAARAAGRLRRRAAELLDRVGLGARAPHRPAELSGGEQQRAALARALMNDPDLILADEPTGNLDSETGDQVLAHLFGLTRERGRTLVLVTHNDAVAGRCDRRLRLKDGCLA